MVYGVLRFINFAHGDVFMLGAYVGLYSGRYLSANGDRSLHRPGVRPGDFQIVSPFRNRDERWLRSAAAGRGLRFDHGRRVAVLDYAAINLWAGPQFLNNFAELDSYWSGYHEQ